MRKFIKIKIHPLFYITLFIFVTLELAQYFIILFAVTTIHELAHVFVALAFKCKLNKIELLPIGEIAVIEDIDILPTSKKLLIYLAGPLINIFTALVIFFFKDYILYGNFIFSASLAIGLFNLLPVFPFDGGRILHQCLGNVSGILTSSKVLNILNNVFFGLFLLLGIVQVILYPYNLSILLVGLYISFINKKEKANMTFSFYKSLLSKNKKIIKNKYLPVKLVVITKDMDFAKLLKLISWDFFIIAHVYENGKLIKQITEAEIVEHLLASGMSGKVNDIPTDILI